jgi:23S rRNA pseudouridine1911/1915/1917 synthase
MTPARRRAVPAPLAAAVAGLGRQALHATVLGFRHPEGPETLRFEREIPSPVRELSELLDRL